MKPHMPARDSAPLYAELLLNEWCHRVVWHEESDVYYEFLRSQATHTIGSRGYPYFLAVRAIEGKS